MYELPFLRMQRDWFLRAHLSNFINESTLCHRVYQLHLFRWPSSQFSLQSFLELGHGLFILVFVRLNILVEFGDELSYFFDVLSASQQSIAFVFLNLDDVQ